MNMKIILVIIICKNMWNSKSELTCIYDINTTEIQVKKETLERKIEEEYEKNALQNQGMRHMAYCGSVNVSSVSVSEALFRFIFNNVSFLYYTGGSTTDFAISTLLCFMTVVVKFIDYSCSCFASLHQNIKRIC